MTQSAASKQASVQLPTVSRRKTLFFGALAGVIATVLFMALHSLLILDIWNMLAPMSISGAVCGLSIAWSYVSAVETPSVTKWITLNAAYIATLVALGLVSMFWFEPTWTFAELSVEGAPLGDLFSRAAPLMVLFALFGALAIWAALGRKLRALGPVVTTEILLVLLLGHNVAIVGLVDFSIGGWASVGEMFGFVILLGAAFAGSFVALERIPRRSPR